MSISPTDHKRGGGTTSSWLILLIETALIAIFSYLVPISAEDMIFTASHRQFLDGEAAWPNFSRLIPDFIETYCTVNGRLVDKLQIIILLMPKWIQALFTAGCFAAIQAGVWMLAGLWAKRGRVALKLLSAIILFAFTAWNENMFLISYVFNYLLTGAICIYITLYFCSDRRMGKLTGWRLASALLIAFILGLWHEIITLILAPALFVFSLLSPRKLILKRMLMFLPLLAGFVIFLFLPGQQDRFGTVDMAVYSFNNILWGYSFIPRYHSVLFIAYPTVLFFYGIYRADLYKGNLIQKFHLLFPDRRRAILVMAAVSAVMVLFLQLRFASLRAATLSVMLISAAAPLLFLPYVKNLNPVLRRVLLTVEGFIIALFLANWLLSTWQQYRLWCAFEDINRIWLSDKDTTNATFYDLPEECATSNSPFHPTTSDFSTQGWKILIMREYRFPGRKDFNPFVVPVSMKEPFTAETISVDPKLGLYKKGKHLFLHTPYNLTIVDPKPNEPYYYLVCFNMKTPEKEQGCYFSLIPFEPEKLGGVAADRNFYYLQPMESYPYMLHLRDAEYDSLMVTTAPILHEPLTD